MHTLNFREISHMTFEAEGWMIGFRTWKLTGYDHNNNVICSVYENERHNYLKYVRFIVALKNHGYKLRECDRIRLKSGEGNFLIRSYISQVTREDIYEIASIAGFSRSEVDNIKYVSEEEQRCFAEMIGLEYYELRDNLHKW
jgi:hypothetical protein